MTKNSIRVWLTLCVVAMIVAACNRTTNKSEMVSKNIEVQGHRGCRGLMPENTIPAFLKAIDLGVTVLELDLAVNKNNELVVSHEPYMNALICLDSMGNEISKKDELSHNIYLMNMDQIRSYDCGSKFFERFPDQQKMQVSKPLLSEVVDAVDQHLLAKGLTPVRYNIEIKSQPIGDEKYHPSPAAFSDLVYQFVQTRMNPALVNLQSFDFRVLKYLNQKYPDIELAMLIENDKTIDQNIEELGFTPDIYSCYYKLLDESKISYLQSLNMKVIPWTVNEVAAIRDMKNWGVDGIISDYPDRVFKVLSE